MPNVRGSGRGHSSAAGSKPDRDQWAAVHRRPEVKRQRQTEQHRRQRADPNSSRASHNAIRDASPDDPTMPPLAWASTWSSRTRRSWPRKTRPARGKRYFAWSFLLPGPAARGMHAAIRSDVAGATGAPGQRDDQTDAGEPDRPLVKRESHRYLLQVRGVTHPVCSLGERSPEGQSGGQTRASGARTSLLSGRQSRKTRTMSPRRVQQEHRAGACDALWFVRDLQKGFMSTAAQRMICIAREHQRQRYG
jgi:hypothetical protein